MKNRLEEIMEKFVLTQDQINLLFNSLMDLQTFYSEFEYGDLRDFKMKELEKFSKLIQCLKNNKTIK